MSEACGRRAERRGGIDDVLGLAGHPYASVLVYVSIAVAGRTSSSVCVLSHARYFFCHSRWSPASLRRRASASGPVARVRSC